MVIGEDWITNLYIGKRINTALVIDTPVYNYFTNENSIMNTFAMSEEYTHRIDRIINCIIGDDPQWDYMKLLKKATCVGDFFYPYHSFSIDIYRTFKSFIAIYGIAPLCQRMDKRFLWFSKYEFFYRIYSWCYRTSKGFIRKRRKMIG